MSAMRLQTMPFQGPELCAVSTKCDKVGASPRVTLHHKSVIVPRETRNEEELSQLHSITLRGKAKKEKLAN